MATAGCKIMWLIRRQARAVGEFLLVPLFVALDKGSFDCVNSFAKGEPMHFAQDDKP